MSITVSLLQVLAAKVSQKRVAIMYSQVSNYPILAVENEIYIVSTELSCKPSIDIDRKFDKTCAIRSNRATVYYVSFVFVTMDSSDILWLTTRAIQSTSISSPG